MKSTIVFFWIILFIFCSEFQSVYAIADSCLKMVEIDDGMNSFNPDSVKVDTCSNSPTFRKWYSRKGFLVGMTFYPISPKPIPPGSKKTWRDIDSQYISIKNSFQALENKFGIFSIRREYENSKDSIELASCVFILDFSNYLLVDSVLYYLRNIDSVMGAYLQNEPLYSSVENEYIKNSFIISPNPASDFIEIEIPPLEWGLGGVSAIIYNIFGQIVLSVGAILELPSRVDVSTLVPGLYFVRLGDKVTKFVKL